MGFNNKPTKSKDEHLNLVSLRWGHCNQKAGSSHAFYGTQDSLSSQQASAYMRYDNMNEPGGSTACSSYLIIDYDLESEVSMPSDRIISYYIESYVIFICSIYLRNIQDINNQIMSCMST
jgi:hypothetical protein